MGLPIHEIGHALGLIHEQTRPDRDNYVDILYNNIDNQYDFDFEKWFYPSVLTYDVPYDYGSIMHYAPTVSHSLYNIIIMRYVSTISYSRSLFNVIIMHNAPTESHFLYVT